MKNKSAKETKAVAEEIIVRPSPSPAVAEKIEKRIRTALGIPGRLSHTCLDLKEGLTLEQWEEVGWALVDRFGVSVQWWIGDWLNYNEDFADAYEKAKEKTGLDVKTLQDNRWVASKVDKSLRRENLSFNHHKVVASLSPEKQREWLDRAEEENWSIRELQSKLNATRKRKPVLQSEREEKVISLAKRLYKDLPSAERIQEVRRLVKLLLKEVAGEEEKAKAAKA